MPTPGGRLVLDRPWRRDDWIALLASLTDGFARAVPSGGSPAAAALPGAAAGDPVPSIEGFARMSVAWGAWLHHPGNPATVVWQGRRHDIAAFLARGLADASDPAHPAWWGPIGDRDQRIVEAAEVSCALWLGGPRLRAALDTADPDAFGRVLDWLAQVDGRDVWPDNWVLFPMLSRLVRRAHGRPVDEAAIDSAVDAMLARDAGDGWTRDGDGHALDLYSGWAINWHLLWWATIAGDRRPTVRRRVIRRGRAWLRFAAAAVADDGAFPRFGRSLGYRFAVAAPFAQAALLGIDPLPPGVARRLAGDLVRHSLAEGAIDAETGWLRIGVGGERPEVVERYVSAGATAWAAHALVGLGLPAADPFWAAPESSADVPTRPVTVAASRAGLLLARHDGETAIHNARSGHPADIPGHDYAATYGKLAYRSGHPFDVPVRADVTAGSDDALVAVETDAGSADGIRIAHRNESIGGAAGPGWIRTTYRLPTDPPLTVRTVVLVLDGVEVRVSWLRPRAPIRLRDGGPALGGDDPPLIREVDPAGPMAVVRDGRRLVAIRALAGFDRAGTTGGSEGRANLVHRAAAHPWVEGAFPDAGPWVVSSALVAGVDGPAGLERLRAVRLERDGSGTVRLTGGEPVTQASLALGGAAPERLLLAGRTFRGRALRVAIAADDGSAFGGDRIASIDGVAVLDRAAIVHVRRSEAGGGSVEATAGVGIAVDRGWAGQRLRWLRIGDGWGFADPVRLSEPGVVPDRLVRAATRRAGTGIITMRLDP